MLLSFGGDLLTKSSIDISLKFSVPKIIIGMTVVSFATSAPELIVSLNATLDGLPSFAIGNVLGSNIANIGLVLGIITIIYPITLKQRFYSTDFPLLMISTGSAIAPFRGFWKHKVAQECNNLKLDWLYFGSRNEEEALFYDEASFHVNVRIAFSRKKGMKKSYVQDLLKQDEIHIYNLIANQQANVYICGRTAMVSAVEATLNAIVGPVANVKALKSNGKLMTEHFG